VILTYLLGALVAIVIAYSLAEMASHIQSRVLLECTREKYLSNWAGFSVRRLMVWSRSSRSALR